MYIYFYNPCYGVGIQPFGIPTVYRLTGIPPYIHQASLRSDWIHGIGVETP